MITTISELDEAAASETVPTPTHGRNGLPDLLDWVSGDPARARAAWVYVSTRGHSGDLQYDTALRDQCRIFRALILANADLSDIEADRVDIGPDSRPLWTGRVARQ